ncbi:cysteine--tRNA ligase [Miniphocaeibacter halophilus]|uniref:Cysteine--tRNA ligase n=1 Tax=Miniphocaeibacter halophilus TaxID=2931922 RepID=A0AC61MSC3_9FIRM|nr:cysteine--tRNA ligase [Miniphocaeibacter halophilus]QQK08527.1 cysteine--tRNA ligase [Miniphocaeibacter halophilus]
MKIYNTLTRKKEEFVPIEEGKVGIYVCGPTVYNFIHVGNARPMVVFDTLRRYFLYKGYDVKYVSNFTDIDDKIINKAKEEGVEFSEITKKYINAYLENSRELNFLEDKTIHPKATEYINPMIDFVSGLEKKGAAYNVDGDVYFDITKAKDYGKLSKKNIDELQAGARISVTDEKKNPMDFALWKKRKEETEPAWESPWGMGRPGWHLECSVMAGSILGETIDIHAGGEDLQFPHHENEIAQSETLHDAKFANYWMHNSMITVDNEKMSKSKGNFFLLNDIRKSYDLEIVRFWLLSVHYRKPINFSEEVMEQTKNGLERLYNGKKNLQKLLKTASGQLSEDEKGTIEKVDEIVKDFEVAMDDDLNTADGISSIYELVKLANSTLNEKSSKELVEYIYTSLMKLANVIGILYKEDKEESLDEQVEKLIAERQEARKNKNFQRADEIRDELKEMGITLKDTREGVEWSIDK